QPDSIKLPTPPATTSSSAHTRGSAQVTTSLSESASKDTTGTSACKPSSSATATGTTTKANHTETLPCNLYCTTEANHDDNTNTSRTLHTLGTRARIHQRRRPTLRQLRQTTHHPRNPGTQRTLEQHKRQESKPHHSTPLAEIHPATRTHSDNSNTGTPNATEHLW